MPCYWPDFNKGHLVEALEQFAARERRFGGLAASGAAS
jgi:undecaprenyl diphosphate synthase